MKMICFWFETKPTTLLTYFIKEAIFLCEEQVLYTLHDDTRYHISLTI